MASSTVAKPRRRTSTGSFAAKLIGVSCIMIVLIKHSFIFLIAGMLPSVVAYLVDQTPGKTTFKTVTTANAAGMVTYLLELVERDNTADAVQEVISNPSVWLMVYSAAGFGWILVWLCPWVVEFSIDLFSENKVRLLEVEQAKLEEEWGADIKGD